MAYDPYGKMAYDPYGGLQRKVKLPAPFNRISAAYKSGG
jgi:hypothetical protein